MKLKEIELRRSIREYTNELLNDEQLNNIIDSAMHTATSINSQAFKLVVVPKAKMTNILYRLTNDQPHVKMASHNIFIFTMNPKTMPVEFIKNIVKTYKKPEEVEPQAQALLNGYRTTSKDILGAGYAIVNTMSLEAIANGVSSTIYSGFDKAGILKYFENVIDINLYQTFVAISLGIKSNKALILPKDTTWKDKVIKL